MEASGSGTRSPVVKQGEQGERKCPQAQGRLHELAIRRGLPLATIDGKLKLTAQTVGVALFDVS
jgi:hypothetical protein